MISIGKVSPLIGIVVLSMLHGSTKVYAAVGGNDYSKPENWLCRPDRTGACAARQDTSIVTPAGSVAVEPYEPNPSAPVDCFYVYPTSSEDRTANSDMQPGQEIEATTRQFGRFGSLCRQFAPVYRSTTLYALYSKVVGRPLPDENPELAFRDVLDAWNYYVSHDNNGRGIVLIGHSQGAHLLIRLIQEQIEGKPIAQRLVSAVIPGWTVLTPPDQAVGGTFKSTPLCQHAGQYGCVIAYSSYRTNVPPSVDPPARFGHSPDGMRAACTNPAALGSTESAILDSYFSKGTIPWSHSETIATPFVRVPGLVRGRCITRGEYSYLEIDVAADLLDGRTDTIPGDLMVRGTPDAAWGLHSADIALATGNLLHVVAEQSSNWTSSGHSSK